jgi:hypothetical protein
MLAQSAPIDRYVFPEHAQYARMQMLEHRIVRRQRNRVVQLASPALSSARRYRSNSRSDAAMSFLSPAFARSAAKYAVAPSRTRRNSRISSRNAG